MIRIQDNTAALTVQRHITLNSADAAQSQTKLGTGQRINHAGDDAAGLFISTNLQADIRGKQKALENVQDALGFVKYAQDTYMQVQSIFHRINELAIQSANSTYTNNDRANMQVEIDQLKNQITQISDGTYWNGTAVFQNPSGTAINIQIGQNQTSQDMLDINGTGNNPFGYLSFSAWGLNNIDVSTQANAQASLNTLNTNGLMFNRLLDRIARQGSIQNRLEGIAQNLQLEIENLSAVNSRFVDTDIANEAAKLANVQVKQQSSTAMLTQASRQQGQIALQLINQ